MKTIEKRSRILKEYLFDKYQKEDFKNNLIKEAMLEFSNQVDDKDVISFSIKREWEEFTEHYIEYVVEITYEIN